MGPNRSSQEFTFAGGDGGPTGRASERVRLVSSSKDVSHTELERGTVHSGPERVVLDTVLRERGRKSRNSTDGWANMSVAVKQRDSVL